VKSEKGVELTDAKGISLSNLQLITEAKNPVVFIDNSMNLTLDKIDFNKDTDLFMSVNGERSTNITLTKTDVSKAKKEAVFLKGAPEKSLIKRGSK